MNERLKELRKSLGFTQQAMADKLGIKRNTVATYEIGKAIPSDRTISDICREFHVNEEWLRSGTGEMFTPQRKSDEIARFLADVMMEDESEFKFRLTSALAKMDDKGWDEIEKLIERINEKNEKK